jgi:hypothetical protein
MSSRQTVLQLRAIAKKQGIIGYSRMRKDELLSAIKSKRRSSKKKNITVVIHFRHLGSKDLNFSTVFNDTDKVGVMRQVVAEHDHWPDDSFRLILKGKQLLDERNLHSYDVMNDTVIHVIKKFGNLIRPEPVAVKASLRKLEKLVQPQKR